MRRLAIVVAFALLGAPHVYAQAPSRCRVLCAPDFSVEPTVSVSNIFRAPRIVGKQGVTERARRETEFEVILSLGLPTRASWLDFTVEAGFVPFDRQGTPELEFEANFTWLPSERTGGWISSHFDVVDDFSPAARPGDRRAYTHKLNLEVDTSIAIFKWLRDGRWLRGVELEGSLDYVATGLPKAGDRIDGFTYLDRASPWSFSIVFVLPVAPF